MTTHETSPAKTSPDKRQRIAKLMARAGLCSRRDAEAWIVDGRVSVNGTVLTSPALDVSDDDVILVDDAPLPNVEKTRLFLFHKPRGLVTSDHDPEGRETVADYLHEHWPDGPRVVTIGRLDINTEGLLLLTNDGGLARALELPATGWVRRYRVRAKGTANPADLDALAAGLTIDGIDYAGIEAKLDRVQGANSWLTMGLREGKNREIKRVLEHLGLEVNRLIRLSFGPFQLLDLEEGAVEEVKTRVLRDQLGEKLAEQAGVDFGETAPIVPPPRDDRPPRRSDHKGADTRGKPDGSRAPRATPGGRSTRPPPGRATARPNRRDERDGAPLPVRERPVAGTRRHVSTLRADGSEDARKGPRKRIERTDTLDRRDRTVTVERRVSARPKEAEVERPRRGRPEVGSEGTFPEKRPARRPESEGRGRPAGDGFGPRRRPDAEGRGRAERESTVPRRRPDAADAPRTRSTRSDDRPARADARPARVDGRPARTDTRPARTSGPRTDESRAPRRGDDRGQGRGDRPVAPRGHGSPSAIGKRERMARSGAPREQGRETRDARRDERGFGAERSETRSFDTGRKVRSTRPERDTERAAPRTPRSDDKRRDRPSPGRDERRPPRSDTGGGRRSDADRPKRARPTVEGRDGQRDGRREERGPRSGSGKPAGRPMGAASRKPNSRKPAGDGAPRAPGPRGTGRPGPNRDDKPRGGPSKPRR